MHHVGKYGEGVDYEICEAPLMTIVYNKVHMDLGV